MGKKGVVWDLVRFLCYMGVAWIFMRVVPVKWFITWYIPFSFFLLFGTVVFGVIGQGWPFAAPGGFLGSLVGNRVLPGALLAALWIGVALFLNWVMTTLWPRVPLFPTGIWFGIIVFMVTLWYTLDIGPYPYREAYANFLLGFVLILVLSGLLWWLCVNLNGTPFEGKAFDPRGKFQAEWWFGLCVWIIMWVQVFGAPLCLQGWPFYKLGKPLHQLVLTAVVVILGYICWVLSLKIGMSPTFSFGGIAATVIGWTLFHSVVFGFYPFAKYKQPLRGFCNFALEIGASVVWVLVVRALMAPIASKAQAMGLGGFDVNAFSAFYTLHAVAIAALVHHFFFLKVPLPMPTPPPGPEEVVGEER